MQVLGCEGRLDPNRAFPFGSKLVTPVPSSQFPVCLLPSSFFLLHPPPGPLCTSWYLLSSEGILRALMIFDAVYLRELLSDNPPDMLCAIEPGPLTLTSVNTDCTFLGSPLI
jgi:hypothetical protein